MSLTVLHDKLLKLALDPKYHDLLAILKGGRNGFVYGCRVRFPHALVMTILFHSGGWKQRANFVYKATKQHATNLAKFVVLYKSALLAQKTMSGGKEHRADTFWAGLLGGWIVFGERNAVNEQIVLYVLSRVVTSILPRAGPAVDPTPLQPAPSGGLPHPPGAPYRKPRAPDSRVFQVYAALTWGAVMWLFREKRDRLQGGMVNSMQYLYLDSEVWNSLRNLVWHNV
ncbi:peroxisomal protein [Pseudohyphozyma bogoriensis]|nr:peroxisomal protein [Pseudohyphozyma bogoriensis]